MGFDRLEYQAVVLSLQSESRLYPLTEYIPKCLTPIANQPLLSFQLDLLSKAGFRKILLVVSDSTSTVVRNYLAERFDPLGTNVQLEAVSDGVESADALRLIAHHIHSDFVVVSGDLITDIILHHLAEHHRVHQAACTVLLYRGQVLSKQDLKELPPFMRQKENDRYYLSLASDDQLLYFRSAADIEYDGVVPIPKSLLRSCRRLTVRTDLRDAQCYIFSRWILDLLLSNPRINSIEGELIPYLVTSQFDTEHIEEFRQYELEEAYRYSTSKYHDEHEKGVRCFGFLAPESSYCTRINSLNAFFTGNMKLPNIPVSRNTPWSQIRASNALSEEEEKNFDNTLAGQGLTLGEGCVLNNSVIGKHVRIGDNVTIENSIILAYCTIGEGSVVQDSIICSSIELQPFCEVVRSCVAVELPDHTSCFEEVRTENVF